MNLIILVFNLKPKAQHGCQHNEVPKDHVADHCCIECRSLSRGSDSSIQPPAAHSIPLPFISPFLLFSSVSLSFSLSPTDLDTQEDSTHPSGPHVEITSPKNLIAPVLSS
jgi:hypothetical protein